MKNFEGVKGMDEGKMKRKPSYDIKRQVLGKIYPLDTPFNVIIDISERCNFRCKYCFRSDSDKSKWGYASGNKLMEWELFTQIIDQVQNFKGDIKQISLSNHGEPLCNRKLPDMVKYIKMKGLNSRISIHTNAAMLDEAYALDLADSNIDRIVVSLQGITSEQYREVCGVKIDFDEFYHNLQVLYTNKKNTQIYYKIMDIALGNEEIPRFYKLFEPIGDRVYIETMVPIWKDVDLPDKSKKDNIVVHNKYGDTFAKQECCPLIFHTIVVSPKGDVYPCTQLMTPYKLGNVLDIPLVELWNLPFRRELLIKQCKMDNPLICSDCYIRQNSIYTRNDMIDEYRLEILERLQKEKRGNE